MKLSDIRAVGGRGCEGEALRQDGIILIYLSYMMLYVVTYLTHQVDLPEANLNTTLIKTMIIKAGRTRCISRAYSAVF